MKKNETRGGKKNKVALERDWNNWLSSLLLYTHSVLIGDGDTGEVAFVILFQRTFMQHKNQS